MNQLDDVTSIVVQCVSIALALAGIAFSVIAIRRRQPWFAIVAVAPVAFTLIASALSSPGDTGPVLGLIFTLALTALGVVGGSPLVALVLHLAAPNGPQLGLHGGILVRDTTSAAPQRDKEVLRGGTTIGYLERFALIGSVLAGQFAAVAIVVAIKGLGRFSELESAQARERFIIGTLGSLVWAATCAAAIVLSW